MKKDDEPFIGVFAKATNQTSYGHALNCPCKYCKADPNKQEALRQMVAEQAKLTRS